MVYGVVTSRRLGRHREEGGEEKEDGSGKELGVRLSYTCNEGYILVLLTGREERRTV